MYELKQMTLVEMIQKSTALYGDRPALCMAGGEQFSYREIGTRTKTIAARLLALGIVRQDRVAIAAESSPYWGIAYLGAVRAGAIVVPILPDFTPDQIKNILTHSEAKAVFCSDKLFNRLKDIELPVTLLDIKQGEIRKSPLVLDPAALSKESEAILAIFEDAAAEPDDTLMIVYTSGTTGLSKGVMLSHRNILSNALGCRSIIILHRNDRLLSILPLAHTYEFTIGFIIPFLAGSQIFYLDRPPAATVLLPALQLVRPTIMLSVPLVIEKVYRSSVKPTMEAIHLYKNRFFKPLIIKIAGMKLKKTFGGQLRFFGIGGAPLAADVEEFLKKAGFPYAIGYGLTETSPLLAGCNPQHTHLRSTGPALTGVAIRIANPRPDTHEGEIQAKGPNIFKGYFKDELRTKEAFTEDGWFKTGDLGYVDEKGRLFVRGRIKTMILGASGENIYPEEIEAVINQSPYVQESLVLEDEKGLTALICLKSEVLENLQSRLQDEADEVGALASRVGNALSNAEKSVADTMSQAFSSAEKAAEKLLETIKKEANDKLAAFSRIRSVKLHAEPFEKTPTQKIKRFIYTKDAKAEDKKSNQEG